jgi:hypothetical protein
MNVVFSSETLVLQEDYTALYSQDDTINNYRCENINHTQLSHCCIFNGILDTEPFRLGAKTFRVSRRKHWHSNTRLLTVRSVWCSCGSIKSNLAVRAMCFINFCVKLFQDKHFLQYLFKIPRSTLQFPFYQSCVWCKNCPILCPF